MGWHDAIKDALDVATRLKDAELWQRLIAVQMEGVRLAEENSKLRQDLIDLRKQVQSRQEMAFRDNVYWRCTTEGKSEGPYCPKCFDGNNKFIRMTDQQGDSFWRCTVCEFPMVKPGRNQPARTVTEHDPFVG